MQQYMSNNMDEMSLIRPGIKGLYQLSQNISLLYGSLYVTLCFVLWRFDFGVLTFYFHILSFLFCVLCTMLFILNGAIHEVKTRYRRKDGRKRSCKYFNAFTVYVM